jgi:hypothetical protein
VSDADAGGSDWPFDQPPDAAAITVQAVLDGDPILRVSHDEDDDGWQFLDGREVDISAARLISMAEAVELDPSLEEIAELPPGWIAHRESPNAAWVIEPHD